MKVIRRTSSEEKKKIVSSAYAEAYKAQCYALMNPSIETGVEPTLKAQSEIIEYYRDECSEKLAAIISLQQKLEDPNLDPDEMGGLMTMLQTNQDDLQLMQKHLKSAVEVADDIVALHNKCKVDPLDDVERKLKLLAIATSLPDEETETNKIDWGSIAERSVNTVIGGVAVGGANYALSRLERRDGFGFITNSHNKETIHFLKRKMEN